MVVIVIVFFVERTFRSDVCLLGVVFKELRVWELGVR